MHTITQDFSRLLKFNFLMDIMYLVFFLYTYFVSSTKSASGCCVIGVFECPAVGSSVFSSPFVELTTWNKYRQINKVYHDIAYNNSQNFQSIFQTWHNIFNNFYNEIGRNAFEIWILKNGHIFKQQNFPKISCPKKYEHKNTLFPD